MLPPKCSQPPCMNIEVKTVMKSAPGFWVRRRGTTDHRSINGSPPLNSTKKNRTLSAISAYVTIGTDLSAESSSPIGNILTSAPDYSLQNRTGSFNQKSCLTKIGPCSLLLLVQFHF